MDIAEKLLTVAENEQKVAQLNNQLSECLSGGTVSENDVLDKVYEAGQQSEYDRFWDLYQQNGKATIMEHFFAGRGWTNETFKPKYDIKPTASSWGMFRASKITGDLDEVCSKIGIEFDISKCTYNYFMFGESAFTALGTLDARAGGCQSLFESAKSLKTIKKLIINNNTMTRAFYGCSALENITIEGTTNKAMDFSACTKLTHDSLMSIISALAITTSTLTLTLGSTNLAKLTDPEKAIATDKGWTLA